jgi:flagellar hook-length control protein FliK
MPMMVPALMPEFPKPPPSGSGPRAAQLSDPGASFEVALEGAAKVESGPAEETSAEISSASVEADPKQSEIAPEHVDVPDDVFAEPSELTPKAEGSASDTAEMAGAPEALAGNVPPPNTSAEGAPIAVEPMGRATPSFQTKQFPAQPASAPSAPSGSQGISAAPFHNGALPQNQLPAAHGAPKGAGPRPTQVDAEPIETSRAPATPQIEPVAPSGALQAGPDVGRQSNPRPENPVQNTTALRPAAERAPSVDVKASDQQLLDRKNAAPSSGAQTMPTPDEADPARTPATARALQVETAVRLENATGQPAANESTAARSATVANHSIAPHHQPSSALKLDHAGLNAPISQQHASEEPPLTSNIVRGLSAMVNQRGGTMTMRLDPPELGEMRVQMTIARGVVTAEFQPSTPQAHALLDRNMAALRTALESQGLTVERLVVHANHAGSQQFTRDDQSNSNNFNQSRSEHDAAGRESRGRQEQQSQQQREFRGRDVQFESLFNPSARNSFANEFALSASP